MKFLAAGLLLGGISLSWLGMIYGWGLTPQSWPWIIGSAIGSMLLIGTAGAISKDD